MFLETKYAKTNTKSYELLGLRLQVSFFVGLKTFTLVWSTNKTKKTNKKSIAKEKVESLI